MTDFIDNDFCFVCGTKNPQGLKLKFWVNKKKHQVESDVTFPTFFQGWEGVVHGGMISTVLDEIMVKCTEVKGLKCVTAEINTKLKKPAQTGVRYLLQGRICDIKGKIVICEGKLFDSKNETIASSTAKLFTIEKKNES